MRGFFYAGSERFPKFIWPNNLIMFRVTTNIPSDVLLPYIHSYQLIESTFLSGYEDKLVAPHVIPGLAFNIGRPQTICDLQRRQFLESLIILEPNSQPYSLRFFPGTRMIMLNFKSDGYYRVFGSPPLPCLEELRSQLKETDRYREQIRLIESFLTTTLKHNKKYCRSISSAIALIYSSNGNASIHELEKETFITKRTLERHFLKQTGMNLKIFSRIVRFKKMMKYIAEQQTISLAELARKFGYYDQKHLRQEYLYFTGSLPEVRQFPATGLEQALDF
ncbi:helix-turn-helix domain-containing protein [Chitinophaga sp. ysch24]|uniref:Helix-turn-helix domain-containing protein n=2 Tax=Chitinophaga tropicalis TaxID=2683588 RepID=A0A7K1UD83_9BACT|nr:helix-turn-helix domain-containing protein [Chitinophaga tropicalis]